MYNLVIGYKYYNVFLTLLELLHVKHTKSYSNKYYNEHPYKYSLYGLSKMLSKYQIDNEGVRVNDKQGTLAQLETPFVAYCSNEFVVVSNISDNNIEYIWKNKKINLTHEKFLNIWSGITLLVETNEKSIEPDYKKNKEKELLSGMKQKLLTIIIILILGIAGFTTQFYLDWRYLMLLSLNLGGAYISYLLLLKQMHVNSDQADKICSLFVNQNDCNNILISNASKFASFSWSEVGLAYFFSNIIVIVIFPELYSYIALINICSLPYTLWSVWYQKCEIKQWCPLCLIVQVILWMLFISNVLFRLITQPDFSLQNILLIGCAYLLPLLILNLLVSVISKFRENEKIPQQYNSLKANDVVFDNLLKMKERYDVNKEVSAILWGNPSAKNMITVITNPHCTPCARMHVKLENLLNNTGDAYCIQYILTSFNEELEYSNKLFIAMYQMMKELDFRTFLSKWYREENANRKKLYELYPFDDKDKTMLDEFYKHKKWIEISKINSTPTVLFNGYKLPDEYTVDDLGLLS